jgi:hypothetical protein
MGQNSFFIIYNNEMNVSNVLSAISKNIIYNNNYVFFSTDPNINVQDSELHSKILGTSTLNLFIWDMLTMLTRLHC